MTNMNKQFLQALTISDGDIEAFFLSFKIFIGYAFCQELMRPKMSMYV